MIEIKNIQTIDGEVIRHFIESDTKVSIDGKGLLLLPALIDPHVHFRTPGHEYKENWKSAAKAAIYGGVTTVFDMPNNTPPCTNYVSLMEKKKRIERQLKDVEIPLRHYFYLGADKNHLEEIKACKDHIIGIKVFMGSSTGNLLIQDDATLRKVFKIAAEHDLVVAVHAEDEELIFENRRKLTPPLTYKDHSRIRDSNAAAKAVKRAIALAKEFQTKLYILHVSTKKEIHLIEKAKEHKCPVYAECTPHHLFLDEDAYDTWEGKAQVNPPLRKKSDVKALWKAVNDGVIDCIGSDHAPHTEEEKQKPYGAAPSGMPGVETTLALLLNAYHEKKIPLRKIVDLTSRNIHDIFSFKSNDDVVIVDLNLEKKVTKSDLYSKAGWSCYENMRLKGWPVHTIIKGKIFSHE